MTQEDLAGKANIHRTYLSDIERGTRNPSLINIERLAYALACPSRNCFISSNTRKTVSAGNPIDRTMGSLPFPHRKLKAVKECYLNTSCMLAP